MIDLNDQPAVTRLRVAAKNVYSTIDGQILIDELLEDFGLYEIPDDEEDMIAKRVLHDFGVYFMRKYHGAMLDDAAHRSRITKVLISVAEPFRVFTEGEE